MDGASRRQLEHRSQRSSLEAIVRNRFRMGEHAYRVIGGIVLILIVTVAVGILICATLALVGLDCPNARTA
jgi:hypothetical protein